MSSNGLHIYRGEDGIERYALNDVIHKMPTEIRDYTFRGWDWNELSYAFGFGELDDEGGFDFGDMDEDVLFELTRHRVRESNVGLLRKFVEALAKHESGYWHHVWRGLLNIPEGDGDYTFVQVVYTTLGHMWD